MNRSEAGERPAAPPRRRYRIWLNLALLGALIAGIIAFVDVRGVAALLVAVPPMAVLAALALATLDRLLMGLKWRHLLTALGVRVSVSQAVSAYYQASFASRVLPLAAAQDVLRGYLLHRSGVGAGVLLGSVTMEKLIAVLASVMLGGAGAAILVTGLTADARASLVITLVAAFAAALGGIALALSPPLHRVVLPALRPRLPARLTRAADQASASLLLYRRAPGTLVVNLGLALLEQLTLLAKYYVIGRAMGITAPVVTFVAIIAVVLITRRVTGYLDGWGITEAAGVVTFTLLGIDADRAVALIATNYAVTTIAALPGAVLLYRSRVTA